MSCRQQTISDNTIQNVVENVVAEKRGEFIDVYVLILETVAEDRVDTKVILHEMVDNGIVVPYPGSRYKVKKDQTGPVYGIA